MPLTPRLRSAPFHKFYVVVADRFRRSDSRFLSLAHGHELRALCSSSILAKREYCMTSRPSIFCQATRGTISIKMERAPHKEGVTSVCSFQQHDISILTRFWRLTKGYNNLVRSHPRQLGAGCHGKSDMETQSVTRYPRAKHV